MLLLRLLLPQAILKWLWTDGWCRMTIVGWVRAWRTTRRPATASDCCWSAEWRVTRSGRWEQACLFRTTLHHSAGWWIFKHYVLHIVAINTFSLVRFFCTNTPSVLFLFSNFVFLLSLHHFQHDGIFAKFSSLFHSFLSKILSGKVQEVTLLWQLCDLV